MFFCLKFKCIWLSKAKTTKPKNNVPQITDSGIHNKQMFSSTAELNCFSWGTVLCLLKLWNIVLFWSFFVFGHWKQRITHFLLILPSFMWLFCHLFFFFLFLFAYILLMLSGFFKHISDFIPLDFLLAFPRHSMSVPCLFFQILVLVASTTER